MTNLINNAFIHAFDEEHEGEVRIVARAPPQKIKSALWSAITGKAFWHPTSAVFLIRFSPRLGQGGSGLGLNIVYNLVHEVLEGSISVESKPGQGTRFELLLPAVVQAAAGAQQSVPVSAGTSAEETSYSHNPVLTLACLPAHLLKCRHA
jgi:signal transduction histidine kinase